MPPLTCRTCRKPYAANGGHCAACHESFTGLEAFDAHRSGDFTVRRYCRPPADVGLVPNLHGYWGRPMTDEARERLATLRDTPVTFGA